MLNKIDILNAYEFILGRKPENDDVVEFYLNQCESVVELRNIFLHSEEFLKQIYGGGGGYIQDRGILSEDFNLLQRYLKLEKLPQKGYLTDFMGIKHSIEDLCFIRDRDGDVVNKIPVPDDTFHADAIEYVGVSKAVEEAGDAFTMFEFGAGWGPWMATSGIACQMRGGFKIINLTGVEGDINKISYIQNHLKKNNLMPQEAQLKGTISNINTAIYHGVVNTDGAPMKFPQVKSDNYGASLLEDTFFYNNLVEVPGYSPVFLFKEYDIVDLVHIDIQGYEGVLLSDVNMISTFKQKVKYICLGTHSRKIEGDLFEHLYNNGFYLLRETPCKVSLPLTKPKSFIDITKADGTQIWRNLSIK